MEGRYAGRCLGMWRALEAGEGSHPVGSSSKDLFPSDRPHSDNVRLHHKHSNILKQAPEADGGGALLVPWIRHWREPHPGCAAQRAPYAIVVGKGSED